MGDWGNRSVGKMLARHKVPGPNVKKKKKNLLGSDGLCL